MATARQDLGFAQQVAEVIRAHVPEARVILYGSRARGDAQPDSDWDVLIVAPAPLSWDLRSQIHDRVLELELDANQIASLMWETNASWKDAERVEEPFVDAVNQEGMVLRP